MGGYQDFLSKIICLTVPKKIRRGTLSCFTNFGYQKCFDKRGGVSRFSVENNLSHRAEKFRRGTL